MDSRYSLSCACEEPEGDFIGGVTRGQGLVKSPRFGEEAFYSLTPLLHCLGAKRRKSISHRLFPAILLRGSLSLHLLQEVLLRMVVELDGEEEGSCVSSRL